MPAAPLAIFGGNSGDRFTLTCFVLMVQKLEAGL